MSETIEFVFAIQSEQAFEQALEVGLLNKEPSSPRFVGDYMYMATMDGKHQFKHIITRKYIFMVATQ